MARSATRFSTLMRVGHILTAASGLNHVQGIESTVSTVRARGGKDHSEQMYSTGVGLYFIQAKDKSLEKRLSRSRKTESSPTTCPHRPTITCRYLSSLFAKPYFSFSTLAKALVCCVKMCAVNVQLRASGNVAASQRTAVSTPGMRPSCLTLYQPCQQRQTEKLLRRIFHRKERYAGARGGSHDVCVEVLAAAVARKHRHSSCRLHSHQLVLLLLLLK
jgi:hypothetical protein